MIIMIITHDSYYSLTTCPVPDTMLRIFHPLSEFLLIEVLGLKNYYFTQVAELDMTERLNNNNSRKGHNLSIPKTSMGHGFSLTQNLAPSGQAITTPCLWRAHLPFLCSLWPRHLVAGQLPLPFSGFCYLHRRAEATGL